MMSPKCTPRSERRPDSREAARRLLAEAAARFPFHLSPARLCTGPCTGCPKKMLEYSDQLIAAWHARLQQQAPPSLGEVTELARQLHKLARAFERNGLLEKS